MRRKIERTKEFEEEQVERDGEREEWKKERDIISDKVTRIPFYRVSSAFI